jgi:uncharacterized membrane protein YhiD involved in acid resistance
MNVQSSLSRFIHFVLVVTLVASSLFSFGVPVYANPTLTPEAEEYNTDKTPNQIEVPMDKLQNKGKETAQEAKEKAKNAANEVKEKLNLDEPLPSDTKKFFRQLTSEEGVYNTNNPDY